MEEKSRRQLQIASNFGHDNPWRTVALILGAMLVAALVHPPLASASSTLIASITANVVTPAILVGSYPAVSYLVAGRQRVGNQRRGRGRHARIVRGERGRGVRGGERAGAGGDGRAQNGNRAHQTGRRRVLRSRFPEYNRRLSPQPRRGVGSAASASTVEDANVNATAATASVTGDQPDGGRGTTRARRG
jgi:hypothetical protein